MWAGGSGGGLETHAVIGFSNIQGYLVKETLHSDARSRDSVMLCWWWGLPVNSSGQLARKVQWRKNASRHGKCWFALSTYLLDTSKCCHSLIRDPAFRNRRGWVQCSCVSVWAWEEDDCLYLQWPAQPRLIGRTIDKYQYGEQQQHYHQDTRLLCFGLMSIVQM